MTEEDKAAFEAFYKAQPQFVQRRIIRLDAEEFWRAALQYERARREEIDRDH